MSTVKFQNN